MISSEISLLKRVNRPHSSILSNVPQVYCVTTHPIFASETEVKLSSNYKICKARD